ncbi:MAG: PAS domain-containing protein [Pseudomonadales bacterium]
MTNRDVLLDVERLKMVLDGSELGFWDWNIDSGKVKRNDRWAQILGYSTIDEFEDDTESWTNSIHPDDRDAAWASINNHKDGLTDSHKMEYRMLTKDENYRWILDHAKIVQRDNEGRAIRMSGTHSDISERKKLEEERDNLVQSLRMALSEIRTLKGIIPICSYCRNVRNDQGAWDQLEANIMANFEARFSHGICPDCLPKTFADLRSDKSPE